jgi:predicted RNase H-like HicB family nuclease
VKLKAIIREAEEGGFWAEVPALPGCFTQGETLQELEANLHEAIEGWLLAAEPMEEIASGRIFGSCGMKAVSGKHFAKLAEQKG